MAVLFGFIIEPCSFIVELLLVIFHLSLSNIMECFTHRVKEQEVKQKFPWSAIPNMSTIVAYSEVFERC